jgi:hypothetical protein
LRTLRRLAEQTNKRDSNSPEYLFKLAKQVRQARENRNGFQIRPPIKQGHAFVRLELADHIHIFYQRFEWLTAHGDNFTQLFNLCRSQMAL